jgi:hypothetical protein
MSASQRSLWLIWAVFGGALALELVIAGRLPARAVPWHAAQAAVAQFVLALIALAIGVWTFALRESLALRDLRAGRLLPHTVAGAARLRGMWLVLWGLTLVVGALGGVLAWGSASPRAALPYVLGAAVLIAIHAPRARYLGLLGTAQSSASQP